MFETIDLFKTTGTSNTTGVLRSVLRVSVDDGLSLSLAGIGHVFLT